MVRWEKILCPTKKKNLFPTLILFTFRYSTLSSFEMVEQKLTPGK